MIRMLGRSMTSIVLLALAVACTHAPLFIKDLDEQEIQRVSDDDLCRASSTFQETRGRTYQNIEGEIARRGLTCGAQARTPVAEPAETEPAEPAEPAQVTVQALRNVNMRAGPGTSHRVLGVLRPGDEVTVVRVVGTWCECMTADDRRVYVSCGLLSVPPGGWATFQSTPSSGAASNAIVGTWELAGERCCGDNSLRGPWAPVPSRERERVTFLSSGRFVSNNPHQSQGHWSVRNGAIEGWVSYSVGFEITGDTMIMYHQPTSSQNAYAHQWRRVPAVQSAQSSSPPRQIRLTPIEATADSPNCNLFLTAQLDTLVGERYLGWSYWIIGLDGRDYRLQVRRSTSSPDTMSSEDGTIRVSIQQGPALRGSRDSSRPSRLSRVNVTVTMNGRLSELPAYQYCQDH